MTAQVWISAVSLLRRCEQFLSACTYRVLYMLSCRSGRCFSVQRIGRSAVSVGTVTQAVHSCSLCAYTAVSAEGTPWQGSQHTCSSS
jgi:hypothetical protein